MKAPTRIHPNRQFRFTTTNGRPLNSACALANNCGRRNSPAKRSGRGKTVLVKVSQHALDVDEDDVSSHVIHPRHPYEGLLLYTIDLYRLDEGASAAHAVDLEELLSDEEAVTIIEWAERMGRYPLPPAAWNISITGDGDAPRTISINVLE